ncbi:MAG: Pyridine nucleotide-disulfide oxidoreductase, FAD/NAD(P)-binding domain protein [Candidatus Acidoferrum typicum]|nr:Pyridine nucleotide-disulfide oxidoreductase, FAD/NAD(P)-binding domain protein [Candidatus Acidoferrum typicum]
MTMGLDKLVSNNINISGLSDSHVGGGTSRNTDKTRIVILGGGFAGVAAAQYLDRTAAKKTDVEVTLVSRENFTLFTPMLHEVAAGDLEPVHISNPLRKLLRRVTILIGDITTIDLAARRVTISYGVRRLSVDLPFDYLLLALGSETSYFGIPGVAERAHGIKSLGDAVMLRAGVIAMLELASVEPDPDRRKRMLTFVVAGGGFAGVETVGAINDLARESLPHYGRIDPREVRVVLIHGGPVILPELGEALGLYAQQNLKKRQVEIKLRTKVIAYKDGAVLCDDGEKVPAETVVWAAGVSPSPMLKEIPWELQKGRVVVDPNLEVPQFSGVWAVGDCAAVIDPTSKTPYPPTAQHALREGRRAGKNIYARLKGEKTTPFVYKAPGQLASIGRRTGVARIFGLKFSGVLGWVLWRTIYVMKLPRLEKKLRVMLQWVLDVAFERDLGQYVTLRDVETLNRLLETARHHNA